MANTKKIRPSTIVNEMAGLTGLGEDEINRAFSKELGVSELELSLDELPLEQLRLVLLNYLDAIHEEMKVIDLPSSAVGKLSSIAQ